MRVPPLIDELFSGTEDDFSKPRTAKEFEKWWSDTANRVSADKEARHYARVNKKPFLMKRFWEEALPMLYVIRVHYNSDDLWCRLGVENDASDADVIHADGSLERSFQIVYATDGATEQYRNLELNHFGFVTQTGKPRPVKKHQSPTVPTTTEWIKHSETVDEKIALIVDRIVKKSGKRNYPPEMALVVGFDDSLLDFEDGPTILAAVQNLTIPFAQVFVVGSCGKLLLTKAQRQKRPSV